MKKITLSYEEFLSKLKFSITDRKPINKEALDIEFEPVHIKSEDPFNQYFISMSKYFRQNMSVKNSNIKKKVL